jgi:hypothetical protein
MVRAALARVPKERRVFRSRGQAGAALAVTVLLPALVGLPALYKATGPLPLRLAIAVLSVAVAVDCWRISRCAVVVVDDGLVVVGRWSRQAYRWDEVDRFAASRRGFRCVLLLADGRRQRITAIPAATKSGRRMIATLNARIQRSQGSPQRNPLR